MKNNESKNFGVLPAVNRWGYTPEGDRLKSTTGADDKMMWGYLYVFMNAEILGIYLMNVSYGDPSTKESLTLMCPVTAGSVTISSPASSLHI